MLCSKKISCTELTQNYLNNIKNNNDLNCYVNITESNALESAKKVDNKIKLIIFDLDGTLVNSLVDLASAANNALKKFGYPSHDTEKYRYFVGDIFIKNLCQ